jgi:hypothetical protein
MGRECCYNYYLEYDQYKRNDSIPSQRNSFGQFVLPAPTWLPTILTSSHSRLPTLGQAYLEEKRKLRTLTLSDKNV